MFHILDFISKGFYQIASIYIISININERLYEYLKGTFHVIKCNLAILDFNTCMCGIALSIYLQRLMTFKHLETVKSLMAYTHKS